MLDPETEIRQLKELVTRLQEELERRQQFSESTTQQTLAEAMQGTLQLQATVRQLRQELERSAFEKD